MTSASFEGKTVLVTGGAGSFGRRFVRHLLDTRRPGRVVVYSRDELKQLQMRDAFSASSVKFVIGDVRDAARVRQAMAGCDVVVHAAALKQVPTAEHNPMECVKTNVYGAENVIDAALSCGVDRVIALSTDKAASPNSLYGATKLAADKLFVAANNLASGRRTRFAVVRYGNYAGSDGSVLPYFRRLVSDGVRELPVTDRRMTRFWITLERGAAFVERCLDRMHGGEIFVPRMPSIRIVDLVASLGPGLAVRETGLRPGERLHELLCPAAESHLTLRFRDHFVIRPHPELVERDIDFAVDRLGERGEPVRDGWEYDSGTNPEQLTVEELRSMNEEVEA